MSLRADLNAFSPNQTFAATQNILLGDLMNLYIAALAATPTQAGVATAANAVTLAAAPTMVFQVVAATVGAGGHTGMKILRILGVNSPANAVPALGECTWQPGSAVITFCPQDVVTTADITYTTAANTACSLLAGSLL